MSGLIFRKKRDFLIRLPIGLIIIAIFAISPIIFSMVGAWIVEYRTGVPCHEGNCVWGAFGWLFLITFPIAGVLLIIYAIIILFDTINFINLNKKRRNNTNKANVRIKK